MGVKKKKRIKKEYIPVAIAVILFIGLIVALVAVILYKPKEKEVVIDPNQHVQEEIAVDNKNSSCKKETLNELYALANKVKADTEILEEKDPNDAKDGDEETKFFTPQITFTNVDSKLYINITRDNDALNEDFTPTDGKIVYKSDYTEDLLTYTVEVKSNGDCKGETVRKFTVTTPIYNVFSRYPICEQITKFKYCQKFILEPLPSIDEFNKQSEQYMKDNKITTTAFNYLEDISTTTKKE